MKAVWRYTIALLVTLLVVALVALLSGITRERRHLVTCGGIDIRILDSARLNFISPEDIRKCLDESYGVWNGQRLDSVNLRKIETVLKDRSAILTSEAWTTGDGILHVAVTQREPLVRFQGPDGGFYSDENGFLFPLQEGYTSRVPIIDGAVPVHTGPGGCTECPRRGGDGTVCGPERENRRGAAVDRRDHRPGPIYRKEQDLGGRHCPDHRRQPRGHPPGAPHRKRDVHLRSA